MTGSAYVSPICACSCVTTTRRGNVSSVAEAEKEGERIEMVYDAVVWSGETCSSFPSFLTISSHRIARGHQSIRYGVQGDKHRQLHWEGKV